MAKPKPPKEKLISIVAESRIVGVTTTARRWGIAPRTVASYVQQVNQDLILSQETEDYIHQILGNTRQQIELTITSAALNLQARMATAETDTDAKIIDAIGSSIKTFGELHVCLETLAAESGLPKDSIPTREPRPMDVTAEALPPASEADDDA